MRKKSLSRPLHAALCAAAMVLILALVRLYCGPPAALSPRAALRRQERQCLLPRETVEYRWDRLDITYLAVRQPGGAWRVYGCCPFNTVPYSGPELKPKGFRLLRLYLNRSGEIQTKVGRGVPWRGTSFFSMKYVYEDLHLRSVKEAHLLFENTDPDARRAELRCTSVSGWEEWQDPREIVSGEGKMSDAFTQGKSLVLEWTASGERLTPRLFDLTLTLTGDSDDPDRDARWNALHSIVAGGRSADGSPVYLEGEVIWYDAEGRELYRQKLDFRQEEETEEEP